MNISMLNQAATVTLRILLFRAGPQDFPHAPALVVWLPAAATAAYVAVFWVVLPPGISFVLGALSVAALALVTHSLLSARRVANRFQQTYHALLATGIVLTLASLPPMAALAPALKQIAANPELLQQPGAVQVSPLASLLLNALNLWNFAVYAHIFRHAAGTRLFTGVLIALFVVLSVLLLSLLFAQMLLPLVKP
jgi:hypothetical protein